MTRTRPCGSVIADSATTAAAWDLMSACRPSALPMTNATSCPRSCQPRIRIASSCVDHPAPRSSSATLRKPAQAAAIRSASAASICSTLLPRSRAAGLSSTTSSAHSRGSRRAYSAKPASTHPGIRCPRATTRSFKLRGGGCASAARRRPQLLEVVVSADRGLHDVHDDVAGVDEDPLGRLLAFDAEDGGAGFLQLLADVARERLHLPIGVGGGDDHRVVQAGLRADIDHFDVAGLDVLERRDGGLLQRVKTHAWVDRVRSIEYRLKPREAANRQFRPIAHCHAQAPRATPTTKSPAG